MFGLDNKIKVYVWYLIEKLFFDIEFGVYVIVVLVI